MNHFLANVQRENTEKIEKAKGTRGGKPKETIIYEELNILWKNTWKRTIINQININMGKNEFTKLFTFWRSMA